MCQKRIAAVHDVGDGIDLVCPQGDLRVHAGKADVLPVVFAGPDAVKCFIVNAAQFLAPVNVPPDPLGKFGLDEFLPVLGNGRFLFVQNRLSVPVFVLDIVKNTDILLVQGLLKDVVGVLTRLVP